MNRKLLPLLFAVALAGGFAVPAFSQERPSGEVTLLSTNDFHGRHLPFVTGPGDPTSQADDPGRDPFSFGRTAEIGGFARLAAAVEAVRRERGEGNVILVHTGDTFSDDLLGNLTRGEAMIRLMNALGYGFMAFGNHDFDYGLERTRKLAALAAFPMRGANVIDGATGEPLFGAPYRVVEAGGLRVGLLALGYHNTPLTTSPDNVRGLRFTSGIEAARRWVPEVRRKADVVVVVSHQGNKVDQVLAREVPGIDLIIGGHSHDLVAPDPSGPPILQAAADGAALGEATIRVEKGRVTEVRGADRLLWADAFSEEPRFAALVAALRAPHRERLEEKIAEAAAPIPRQYKSESPFDVLVGEMLREETGAETAFLPGVGYGVSLQPGPVTREGLMSLLPHGSTLVTLRLTGRQIEEILEQSAANQKTEDPLEGVGGLVQTSGVRWSADLSRPAGDRVRDIAVNGEPLDPDRSYTAATHSGMLAGTHRYATFAKGTEIRRTDRKVNELVEEAMRRRGRLEPPEAGNVKVLKGG